PLRMRSARRRRPTGMAWLAVLPVISAPFLTAGGGMRAAPRVGGWALAGVRWGGVLSHQASQSWHARARNARVTERLWPAVIRRTASGGTWRARAIRATPWPMAISDRSRQAVPPASIRVPRGVGAPLSAVRELLVTVLPPARAGARRGAVPRCDGRSRWSG